MIIRNNQTVGGLKRLAFLFVLTSSIGAFSFTSGNDVALSESAEIYQHGKASYYAGMFIGRLTANGEIFTSQEYTCAHKTLPFGTKLKVTNLNNNKSIIVRVNDRGPYIKGRIIDLSLKGAKAIDLIQPGVAKVTLEIVNKEFSSVGKVENMEKIFVDDNYAYVHKDDQNKLNKLNTYLEEMGTRYAEYSIVEEILPLNDVESNNDIETSASNDKQTLAIE